MAQEPGEPESLLADLADTSANFGFLLPHEPLLMFHGASAEARMFDAPAQSTSAARLFGEVLASELCGLAGVRPPSTGQLERLRVLTRTGLLPTPVLAAFNDLRQIPDGGAGRPDESVATHLVERCFALAVWFFRLRTGDREPMPFVRTDARVLRALAERVASVEPELPLVQREFAQRTRPTQVSASERERLIVAARQAALEPLAETRIAPQVERGLARAGWTVLESGHDEDVNGSLGCAVRNPYLTGDRRVDYLLLVGGQVVGLVEWKSAVTDLAAAMDQVTTLAEAVADASPWPVWRAPLPYRYVTDGQRLLFLDDHDPEPRPRLVSGFHQPATVARWRREAEADTGAPTYRARLAARVPDLTTPSPTAGEPRPAQLRAVRAIEQALRSGQRRALVQMATGTGKTFTGVLTAYRQLKYAKAHRILFVADRAAPAQQAIAQFQQFAAPDGGRRFTDLYNVDELPPAGPAQSTKVAVTTVQRLSAMLAGVPGPDAGSDRVSAFETAERVPPSDITPIDVTYSATLPPDAFDLVVVNECHQWIYGEGRALLEYFDAPVLGFTATPVAPVYGFFQGNLVSAYPYEQAIADGLVVDHSVYQARIESPGRAVLVPLNEHTDLKDKLPLRTRYELLDEDLAYAGPVGAPQILESDALSVVLTALRDSLPRLFPGRGAGAGAIPKTVVFARDDHHAEEIVDRVRTVFGAGAAFCQKITLRSGDPDQLLRDFRTTPEFRIAVVVDLISGSTDMRAVECFLLLRDVRSSAYYEQLLGRGAQRIASADLRAVTPEAFAKTQFVVIDAVGATRHHRRQLVNVTDTAGSAGRAALARLFDRTAEGATSPDETAELGLRLARLIPVLTEPDSAAVTTLAGMSLEELVSGLLATVDADHLAHVRATGGEHAVDAAAREATAPLAELPELRGLLLRLYHGPTPSGSKAVGRHTPAAEAVYRRLDTFKKHQAGHFTATQLWWIENIAEFAATGARFDPADLDGMPFSGRGGTDGFLREFGTDRAVGLLHELDRELA
ncbi:DEAD/DEAH box helicase family protein [Streptomyces sp. QTS52]